MSSLFIINLFWWFQDGDFLIFSKCSLYTHFVLDSVLAVGVKMLLDHAKIFPPEAYLLTKGTSK